MKPYLTRAILLAAVLLLFYAACKKNALQPAPSAANTDYAAISGQAAVTLYQAITGQNGGTDVSQGINADAGGSSLTLYSTAPKCGQIIDSTYSRVWHSGGPIYIGSDTIFNYTRTWKYVFTCDAGKVDGYQVYDIVINRQQSPYIMNIDSVVQSYAVKDLNQTRTITSINGSLYSAVYLDQIIAETGSSQFETYKLNQLIVNSTSGKADVTSGTATFHMVVYAQHSFDSFGKPEKPAIYDGSIQFLGNHMAKLTINPGHVYLVNLITGVVTPD